jgi:hypothetical protein
MGLVNLLALLVLLFLLMLWWVCTLKYGVSDNFTGDNIEYDYKVELTTSECHYGGVRYWFVCPLTTNGVQCNQRVGKLYLTPQGNYFGCRHCHNITYADRNMSKRRRKGINASIDREDKYDTLNNQMKRWTYNGKLTRKARQLLKINARLGYDLECLAEMT